jgi:hypothetical protein
VTRIVEVVTKVFGEPLAILASLVLPLHVDLLELVGGGGEQELEQAALPHPPHQLRGPAQQRHRQEQQRQPLVVRVHNLHRQSAATYLRNGFLCSFSRTVDPDSLDPGF